MVTSSPVSLRGDNLPLGRHQVKMLFNVFFYLCQPAGIAMSYKNIHDIVGIPVILSEHIINKGSIAGQHRAAMMCVPFNA